MDKEQNKYSRENNNLSVIPRNDSKKGKVVIGTLNVLTKERRLLGRSKKMRWITDSGLIIAVAILLFLGSSYLIRTYNIGKNVILEARTLSERVSSGNLETFELIYKNE